MFVIYKGLKEKVFLLLMTIVPFWGICQYNYDKTFYLLDSLQVDSWSEDDKYLVDSLLNVYHNSNQDTTKIGALALICETMGHDDWTRYQFFLYDLFQKKLNDPGLSDKEIFFLKERFVLTYNNIGLIYNNTGDLKKSMIFYKKSLALSEEIGSVENIGNPLCNIGLLYNNIGELDTALQYYDKGVAAYEKVGDKEGFAMAYNNMGAIYDSKGDIVEALHYYHKALKIDEEIDDIAGIALLLNNIGAIYKNQGEIDKAMEYWSKSLKIREEYNDVYSLAYSLTNIASLYLIKGDSAKAIDYIRKGLSIRNQLSDKKGQAQSLNLLGTIYLNIDKLDSAEVMLVKSLELRREIEDKEGLVISLNSLASLALKRNNLTKAKKYASEALKIADEIKFPSSIRDASRILSKIAKRQGLWEEAFTNLELYITMKDSIFNEENAKAAFQKEAQYQYEKRADSLHAEQMKKEALAEANQKRKDEIAQKENEKKNLIIGAGAVGLLLILVFTGFTINRLRITRKQKGIIETQKEIVEEKNKEILDSINYAKRIQLAILPPNKVISEHLPKSFILYKPKDIVAGDFYWLEVKNGKTLFAVADCTGHGVPGAMVSVVCNNGLNRSVREHGLTEPGKILDKAREIVVQEFEKSEDDVRDGMDIALCALQGNKLQYAGAHNPLWIVRNGELIEFKANNQPIGKFDYSEPYQTHDIQVQSDDMLYLFSDGYADQFGGERGKKFKSANFKKLLLSIAQKPLNEQNEIINDAIESWKGEIEQIDDICVVGVRI